MPNCNLAFYVKWVKTSWIYSVKTLLLNDLFYVYTIYMTYQCGNIYKSLLKNTFVYQEVSMSTPKVNQKQNVLIS